MITAVWNWFAVDKLKRRVQYFVLTLAGFSTWVSLCLSCMYALMSLWRRACRSRQEAGEGSTSAELFESALWVSQRGDVGSKVIMEKHSQGDFFLKRIAWLERFLYFCTNIQLLNWNLNVLGLCRSLQVQSPDDLVQSQPFLALSFLTLFRAGMLPINEYILASLLYRFKNTASKSFKTLLLFLKGKLLSWFSPRKILSLTWLFFNPHNHKLKLNVSVIHMGKIRQFIYMPIAEQHVTKGG